MSSPPDEELFVFLQSAPPLNTPMPEGTTEEVAPLAEVPSLDVVGESKEPSLVNAPSEQLAEASVSLPQLKDALNKLSDADLATLSLMDVISSTYAAYLTTWVREETTDGVVYNAKFPFADIGLADEFLRTCSCGVNYGDIAKVTYYKTINGAEVEVSILVAKEEETTEPPSYTDELQERYSELTCPKQPELINRSEPILINNSADTPSNYPSADLALSDGQLTTSLTFGPIVLDASEGNAQNYQRIKLGVALLGSWKHPSYGEVSFTQDDFDQMLSNFNAGAIGFEPPLFLGHASEQVNSGSGIQYSTVEGAPAEGFLSALYQEGNCLFSEWEVNNSSVYEAVAAGRYRYNSGEFVRNYLSKETGESIGTTLIGMALTNRPFVPNLPRVTALSDSQQDELFLFTMGSGDNTTQEKEKLTMEVEKTIDNSAEKLSELQAQVETTKQQLASVEQAYKLQLSDAQATITSLSTQLKEANEAARQKEVDGKLKALEALALPQEVKESYSEMIRTGVLGSAEATVLESLKKTAELTTLITQQGTTQETSALNDPSVNPYQSTIDRNRAAVASRSQAL